MPTYEYKCRKCGTIQEVFQLMTAPTKKRLKCSLCEKVTGVDRMIGSGGGIIFKGSGFYATDYRSPTYNKDAKKEKSGTPPKKPKK